MSSIIYIDDDKNINLLINLGRVFNILSVLRSSIKNFTGKFIFYLLTIIATPLLIVILIFSWIIIKIIFNRMKYSLKKSFDFNHPINSFETFSLLVRTQKEFTSIVENSNTLKTKALYKKILNFPILSDLMGFLEFISEFNCDLTNYLSYLEKTNNQSISFSFRSQKELLNDITDAYDYVL